jgi:hypothetical protein
MRRRRATERHVAGGSMSHAIVGLTVIALICAVACRNSCGERRRASEVVAAVQERFAEFDEFRGLAINPWRESQIAITLPGRRLTWGFRHPSSRERYRDRVHPDQRRRIDGLRKVMAHSGVMGCDLTGPVQYFETCHWDSTFREIDAADPAYVDEWQTRCHEMYAIVVLRVLRQDDGALKSLAGYARLRTLIKVNDSVYYFRQMADIRPVYAE